jgi:hypothetical protein
MGQDAAVAGGWRKLQGWVDLDQLPWSEAPIGPAAEAAAAPSSQVGAVVAASAFLLHVLLKLALS